MEDGGKSVIARLLICLPMPIWPPSFSLQVKARGKGDPQEHCVFNQHSTLSYERRPFLVLRFHSASLIRSAALKHNQSLRHYQ